MDVRNKRIGLVLSGGGVNGVFSLGVLKALSENGVSFHAVSGTSAGAIVASILSTDSIESAYETIARIRPITARKVATLMLLFLPYVLMRAFQLGGKAWLVGIGTNLLGYPYQTASRRMRIGLHLANLFAPYWLILFLIDVGIAGLNSAIWAIVFFILVNIPIIEAEMSDDTVGLSMWGDRWTPLATHLGFATSIAVGSLALHYHPDHNLLAWLVPVPFSLLIHFMAVRGIDWFAAFEVTKVEDFLRDCVLTRKCEMPAFVCCSYSLEVYDPDNISWRLADDPRASSWTHIGLPIVQTMPLFVNISQLDAHDARSFIIASAAIPVGILPMVHADSKRLADGCLIANSPAYPLLESERCTHLIHINISRDDVSEDDFKNQYRQMHRLLRLTDHVTQPRITTPQHQYAGRSQHNDPPSNLPYIDVLPEFELFTIKAPNEMLLNPLTANHKAIMALRDAGYRMGLEVTSSIRQFLSNGK